MLEIGWLSIGWFGREEIAESENEKSGQPFTTLHPLPPKHIHTLSRPI